MKRILFLMLALLAGLHPRIAAQPLPKHTAAMGASVSYIRYKEPAVMKERGWMYGLDGSYAYHNGLMLSAQARAAFGLVDYKGSGTIENIDDYLIELRGLAGYDFSLSQESVLTPYGGFGYRYLNDDLSGKISTTGAAGYERESRYYYCPVGLEVLTELKNGWQWGAAAEYDFLWWGEQRSHLGDLPGYQDSKNRQNKGYGIRGSLKLQKKNKTSTITVEPYAIYWNIKSSKVSTQATEPKNNSIEGGLRVAIGF